MRSATLMELLTCKGSLDSRTYSKPSKPDSMFTTGFQKATSYALAPRPVGPWPSRSVESTRTLITMPKHDALRTIGNRERQESLTVWLSPSHKALISDCKARLGFDTSSEALALILDTAVELGKTADPLYPALGPQPAGRAVMAAHTRQREDAQRQKDHAAKHVADQDCENVEISGKSFHVPHGNSAWTFAGYVPHKSTEQGLHCPACGYARP